MRAAVGATLLLLALAAPAQASAYLGEHANTDPLVNSALAIGEQFWRDRNVAVCPDISIRLADDLAGSDGIDAAGRTVLGQCVVWVDSFFVDVAHDGLHYKDPDPLEELCVIVTHELGHTAGLEHTPTGIMALKPTVTPWACQRWGAGLIRSRAWKRHGPPKGVIRGPVQQRPY